MEKLNQKDEFLNQIQDQINFVGQLRGPQDREYMSLVASIFT